MATKKRSGEHLVASPVAAGYRMPPEWARHAATWLAFPHHRTDFPGKLSAVVHTFSEMARVIAPGEKVRLLVQDAAERTRAQGIFERAGVAMAEVEFIPCLTNRSWLRDSMPIWVKKKGPKGDVCAVKFRFNGWARYRDHLLDDAAGVAVAKNWSPRCHFPKSANGERLILEGGSIDVDEVGTILTTEACLVTSDRARYGSFDAAETALRENLGARKILWLPDGIAGDDTSGHIDDFARFAPKGRVLVCHESKRSDANFAPLRAARKKLEESTNAAGKKLEVVALPMPDPVVYRGDRLPASYANFYIANAAVLVPVFNDRHDQEALSLISECFPDRPAIGIYARDLVVGLGTLHCSSMQQPA
jgi:agmatine deiminase